MKGKTRYNSEERQSSLHWERQAGVAGSVPPSARPSPARPHPPAGHKSGREGVWLGSVRDAECRVLGGAPRRAHGAGRPPPQRAGGDRQGQDEENDVSPSARRDGKRFPCLQGLWATPAAGAAPRKELLSKALRAAVFNEHLPLLSSSIKDWKTRLSYFLQNSSNSSKRKCKKAGKHCNYFR